MSIETIFASFDDNQIKAMTEIADNQILQILSLTSNEVQHREATDDARRGAIASALSSVTALTNEQLQAITSLNKNEFFNLRARCRQQLVINKINSPETNAHFKKLATLHLHILILQKKLDQELLEGYRITEEKTETGETRYLRVKKEISTLGADDLIAYYNNLDTNGMKELISSLSFSEKIFWLELMEMGTSNSSNDVAENFIDLFESPYMQNSLTGCFTMLIQNQTKLIAQLKEEFDKSYNSNLELLEAHINALQEKGPDSAEIRKEKLKIAYTAKANLIGKDVKYTIDGMSFTAKTNTTLNSTGKRIKCFEQTMISAELSLIDEYIKHQWQNIRIEPDKKKDKIQIACQAKANLIGKDIRINDIDITARNSAKSNSNVFKRIESYEHILLNNKGTLTEEKNSKLLTIVSRIFERITGLFIHNDSLIKPGLNEGHGKKLVKIIEKAASVGRNGIFGSSKSSAPPVENLEKKSIESPISTSTANLMRRGTKL